MRTIILCLFLATYTGTSFSQKWTRADFELANTGKKAKYLNKQEKKLLMYVNLARMYPKRFAKNEVNHYNEIFASPGSPYIKGLYDDLMKMEPKNAFIPDSLLTITSRCLAEQQEVTGEIGHKRNAKCQKLLNNYLAWAECCSYGAKKGKDAALQLLIDDRVESLGHRRSLLGSYDKAGIAQGYSSKLGYSFVIDMAPFKPF